MSGQDCDGARCQAPIRSLLVLPKAFKMPPRLESIDQAEGMMPVSEGVRSEGVRPEPRSLGVNHRIQRSIRHRDPIYLRLLHITAYIPIHPIQETNMIAKGGFDFLGDHLLRPQGRTLRHSTFEKKNLAYQYVALEKDCQAWLVKADCFPPGQKRRYISLTMYYPVYLRASSPSEKRR